MLSASQSATALDAAVAHYREHSDLPVLLASLRSIAQATDPVSLAAAAEPYRDIPEVAGPLYEHIVDARPNDARALVILASAYWLSGRGPDVVADLASRAIAADPANRGAWHLWALAESNPRARTSRWQQVLQRFPADDVARANLADNAASLAGAEHDVAALRLAIDTYEQLLPRAEHPDQRAAVASAIETLKRWRF